MNSALENILMRDGMSTTQAGVSEVDMDILREILLGIKGTSAQRAAIIRIIKQHRHDKNITNSIIKQIRMKSGITIKPIQVSNF